MSGASDERVVVQYCAVVDDNSMMTDRETCRPTPRIFWLFEPLQFFSELELELELNSDIHEYIFYADTLLD